MSPTISRLKWIFGFALILTASTRSASAWLRFDAPDDELVQSSDAIVIGHVESGFTQFEPPRNSPTEPHWWEYRTTLIVTQSLSGKIRPGPIPIIIHYGIRPVLLKDNSSIEDKINPHVFDQNTTINTPVVAVGIKDVCSWGGALTDNIRQDHIWFLSSKQHGGPGPGNEDVSSPGIWSPQQVQTVDRKPYYLAVLSGNPSALNPVLYTGSDWQIQNATECQLRLFVKQIAKVPDLNSRCDQLITIYVAQGPFTSAGELALEKIMDCGRFGSAKLIPLFADSTNHTLDRRSILNAWQGVTPNGLPRGAAFPEGRAVITKWLQDEDQWWSTQTKQDRIFASHGSGDDPRKVSFGNIYCSIEQMGPLDAASIKLIRKIRNRWADAAPFESNNDFLKVCDDVLSPSR